MLFSKKGLSDYVRSVFILDSDPAYELKRLENIIESLLDFLEVIASKRTC